MKPPELSVLWSPSIDTELLSDAHELAPSSEDLSALTDHLGLETPDTLTAALLRPEERELDLVPHFGGNLDLLKYEPAPRPLDALRVYITELSERDILEGFAYALIIRAQHNRRMNVIKWGAITAMTELGVGGIVQQMGSPWGYLGMGLAGATVAGLSLYARGFRNSQVVVPNLDGLESPIRITGRAS